MSGSGDYISREAAKKQMRNGRHSMEWLLESGAKTIGDVFAIILDEVPAADVRPVVKATWKRIDFKPCGHDYECSSCGWKNDMATHYCPNCGAMMEES